jgi:hypothetical protein
MQTELDKMLAGELYDPMDPALVRARDRARDLCQDLNATREADREARRRILRPYGKNEATGTPAAPLCLGESCPWHRRSTGHETPRYR